MVQFEDKVLKLADLFDLKSYIEAKMLCGDTYIYDVRKKAWFPLGSLPVIKQFFPNLRTGLVKKDKPKFHPPFKIPDLEEVKLKKDIKILTERGESQVKQKQKIKTDLTSLMSDVAGNLKTDMEILAKDIMIEELESELKKLKNKNDFLLKENDILEEKDLKNQNEIKEVTSKLNVGEGNNSSEMNLLNQQLENQSSEIQYLKDSNASTKESIELYKEREESFKDEISQLKEETLNQVSTEDEEKIQNYSQMENDAKTIKDEFEVASQRLMHLEKDLEETAKSLKKSERENKELHAIRLKAKKIIQEKKDVIASLKEDKTSLVESKESLEQNIVALRKNESQLVSKVDNFQQKAEESEAKELELVLQKEEEELTNLVGDSYEVPNDMIWYYNDGQEEKGPFMFEKILELKETKEINSKTKIRQEGKSIVKTMDDYFELNTYVVKYKTNSGDNRFFIKRTSFRAPFYEIVTLEIEDKEFKGYCTSLSTGGIFIEFSKIDSDLMKLKEKGRIYFKQGVLSESLANAVQIMNISDKKPRGLGLMFLDLADEKKDIILEYVNNFLEKSKEAA